MIIILFTLWLIFNGRFTADYGMLQICIVGVFVVGFAYFLAYKFLDITPKKELAFVKKIPTLIIYAFVLLKEIILANFKMLKYIAGDKTKLDPVIVQVRIPLRTNFCKVILANSITLTPGTITADFDGDLFTIHCLDDSLADGIEECSFVKILERLEK